MSYYPATYDPRDEIAEYEPLVLSSDITNEAGNIDQPDLFGTYQPVGETYDWYTRAFPRF